MYDLEVLYSINTLLKYTQKKRIYLYTDHPEKFSLLGINVVDITGEVDEWSNSMSYMHRIKIKVIEHALFSHSKKIIFVDSDTFFKRNPEPLFSLINNQNVVLHTFERKDPYPQMAGFSSFLKESLLFQYSKETSMYNSGIVGISEFNQEILTQTLDLIDVMHENFPSIHTIEQLSLSEVLRLNKINITTCQDIVIHYWRSTLRFYMHHKLLKCFQQKHDYSPELIEQQVKIPFSYLRAKLFKLSHIASSGVSC